MEDIGNSVKSYNETRELTIVSPTITPRVNSKCCCCEVMLPEMEAEGFDLYIPQALPENLQVSNHFTGVKV